MSWPRRRRALRRWVERCWIRSRGRAGIWLVPTGDGRLAMMTANGLWAVLTIFEVGQLRDALRRAAFALHQEDVRIVALSRRARGNVDEEELPPFVAPKRKLVVISDHGRVDGAPRPDDMKQAS